MALEVIGLNESSIVQLPSRISVRAVLAGLVVGAALVLLTIVLGAAIFMSGFSPDRSVAKADDRLLHLVARLLRRQRVLRRLGRGVDLSLADAP